MKPVDRDPQLPAATDMAGAGGGKLTGRGCDDLHRFPGAGSNADGLDDAPPPGGPEGSRVVDGDDAWIPAAGRVGGAPPPVAARHDRGGRPGAAAAQGVGGSPRTSRLRPGWYAYRVAGGAELPSWAVEVALTIERPAACPIEVGAAEGRDPPVAGPESPGAGGAAQTTLLLRAPGRLRWLEGIAEAVAEVERVAGLRSADSGGELVDGAPGRRGPRLLMGPALPGLAPVTPAVARAHLRMAGSRGLPPPLRRRWPASGGVELAWRAGAGSVLTCDGPDGRSAQAVVALGGAGTAAAVTPPPGGALVLRAWRTRRGWGVACGLVLGAAATLGLGREAARVAAMARTEGWDASVLSGSAAMDLARAGSPGLPPPPAAAQGAANAQVAALLEACLAAGGLQRRGDLQRRPAGGPWSLAVTP